ncbi:hypothetical protein OCU04_006748 [Sclerotinia nivalis]|uniref:Uncharacterized protein n=1 Tax=Sclerotinia nivalis TaxID=352851 RepID=A0A9X0AKD4_9HELO|nr:hypothetical protein OCU04_006748 [Sclerotinia nivalis]
MSTLSKYFASVLGSQGSSNPKIDLDLNLDHTFFLLVNEEVFASVLEGPSKCEIPFVYVADTDYLTSKEDHEDEKYKRYLKVTMELLKEYR